MPRASVLLALFVLTTTRARADLDVFRMIICGDPQIPWGCCDCNNDSVAASDQDKRDCYDNCDNRLCKQRLYDNVDGQASLG